MLDGIRRGAVVSEYDNPMLGVTGVYVGDKRVEQDGMCLASRVGLERVLLEFSQATIPSLVVRHTIKLTMDFMSLCHYR